MLNSFWSVFLFLLVFFKCIVLVVCLWVVNVFFLVNVIILLVMCCMDFVFVFVVVIWLLMIKFVIKLCSKVFFWLVVWCSFDGIVIIIIFYFCLN